MSSLTIFTCDGCGTTESSQFATHDKPKDWGSFFLSGPEGFTSIKQVPMAEWRRDTQAKTYCPSCIAKMTGVPLPQEKA